MKKGIVNRVRQLEPLVHNITNYVTVNDVANVVLACGGSPIMADDEADVADIISICNGLNVNIGTLNSRTIPSMILAGKCAAHMGKVTVLDPVGAGASGLRTRTAMRLMQEIPFTIVRGNVSEMRALFGQDAKTKGVDADLKDAVTNENLKDAVAFVEACSKKSGAITIMTGAIDLVSDGERTYVIRNGHAMMSRITGTGCMLSALVATYCAANPTELLDAAAGAVMVMGLAGEIAHARVESTPLAGTSSFRTYLIDAISNMTDEMLEEGMKIEG